MEQEITIKCWIKNNRDGKKIGFLAVSDGLSFDTLQIVYHHYLTNFDQIKKLSPGSAIVVFGKFKTANEKEIIELQAIKIEIINATQTDYFLQKKAHSPEFLRQKAELRARSNLFQIIFRIRHSISLAIHNFFANEGFLYLHSPILTSNDCEGGGENFQVSNSLDKEQLFFKKNANLTVSGQLHAESFAQSYQKVYTFGPTFRAEKSNTLSHSSEFWMIEPEIAFGNKAQGILLATKLVKHVIQKIYINHQKELQFLEKKHAINLTNKLKNIFQNDFIQITYTKSLEIINNFDKNVTSLIWGDDLKKEHELFLCQHFDNKPVFVTDYPKKIKAFYMKQNSDQKTVSCFDLLFPKVGEVLGGSERENDYQKIISALKEKKISSKGLEWYLNLRLQGYGGSTGFGLGLDRLLMFITEVNNIRDVIPFYRGYKSLEY